MGQDTEAEVDASKTQTVMRQEQLHNNT